MTPTPAQIPGIDIAQLFKAASPGRDEVDAAIMGAATGSGLLTITGFPEEVRCDAVFRRRLLALFEAPRSLLERLACNRHDASRPPVLHGWFDVNEGRAYYYDGIELGPDVAYGTSVVDLKNPLTGATPLPAESELPGWRAAVRYYYLGMERVADALMRAIARGLGIPEEHFSSLFVGGASALRLMRYPVRAPSSRAAVPEEEGLYVVHNGKMREVISEAHVDFGFTTLLAQDNVDGLQAKMPDGAWVDVPPVDGDLVVNFGKLLQRLTAGRIRATEHRVLSPGRERFSLPFFYAPRLDAEIKPLPLVGAEQFTPFAYGDHTWASLPKFRRLFGQAASARQPRHFTGADKDRPLS
ncbi:MAG: 2OG-Fe(II) oxygenase family protein [Pseudomonadota bacterium]